MDSDDGPVEPFLFDVARYGGIVILVIMSGLFSGLTLGLLGLDLNGLTIVQSGDNAEMAKHATKIIPIRKKGNQLLCTLLLGNVAVNALLSILMADLAGGLAGFLVSTAVITTFGEIVPQATCSRYALQIGARSILIVQVFMFALFPVAKPIAVILDKVLGEEMGQTYTAKEMMKLLLLHETEGKISQDTAQVMEGALKFETNAVNLIDIMTTLDNVFMLNITDKLDYETIKTIFKKGFSRIPVYEIDQKNVIGVVFTKDLVLVDPEDAIPVKTMLTVFNRRFLVFDNEETAQNALGRFRMEKAHLALIQSVVHPENGGDPYYDLLGIVTLEDIIEEIMQLEFVDETDRFDSNRDAMGFRENFDYDKLRLLDCQLVDEHLSGDEISALVAHLTANVDVFRSKIDARILDEDLLRSLLARCVVTTLEPTMPNGTMASIPTRTVSERRQSMGTVSIIPESKRQHQWLFHSSEVATKCVIILSGKVVVLAGKDEWRSEVGMFSVLGQGCLTTREDYRPDFCAHVGAETVRCVYLQKSVFTPALLGDRKKTPRNRPEQQSAPRTTDGSATQMSDSGKTRMFESQHSRARGVSGDSASDMKSPKTFQV
jgi:metal transporter CNNM